MKNMLRLMALVGVVTVSWFATQRPAYAIADCATKEGSACTQVGSAGYCTTYDDGDQCTWIYPCYCDRAFGPLQVRCGPNPSGGSCCGGVWGCP
jgi:hypothetical protein